MKNIKYIFAVVLILAGLGGIFKGSVLGGILLSVLGVLVLPPVSEQIKEKFSFWQKKGVRYASYGVLLLISAGVMKKNDFKSATTSKAGISTSEVANQDYNNKVEKNVANLSENRKQQRDKWLKELKTNPVYIDLVNKSSVSETYLPVLNAISEAIKNTYSEKGEALFNISEDIANAVEKSENGEQKMKFVIALASLSMQMNGGLPKEIVAVFERYKSKFNLYGEAGSTVYDTAGNSVKIEKSYNLAYAFGLFEPNNKKMLDATYESVQKGISQWNESDNAIVNENAFMALKSEYMNHLKKVYSDSPYLINVDFEITASDLAQEYKANEVSADEKFKNKKVAVFGTVEQIGKDVLDNPYISFSGEFLQSVTCYFSKDDIKTISQISKGDKITIIGECTGLTLTNVVIQDCKISE